MHESDDERSWRERPLAAPTAHREAAMLKKIDRARAVADIRESLLRLVDDDHSMCEVAAQKGIHCHGFSQWSFEDLKKCYGWIADRRPHVTRSELEHLANAWQLARQQVFDTRLSCDTQSVEHDTCLGFDGWSDALLARFHAEICGEPVEIAPPR
jgi:hypothetical protein